MRDGATALCVAVSTRQSVLVRILLAAKADPNIADKSGEPVLAKALNPWSVDIAEMLLAAGADPNRHDQNGWLPLSRAALSGSRGSTHQCRRRR
ncbi:MAG: ankyrin repeat domain-containing protein [Oceanipulchritudo sp.]